MAHIGCNSGRSNALRRLAREDCGCTRGLGYCGVLQPAQPRGYIELDPSEV